MQTTPEMAPIGQQENVSLARKMAWWVLILPALMIAALLGHNLSLLNFTHVLSGVLWTGADIFMGFFLGPIMGKRLSPEQRGAVIKWLTPKTMLYFPVLAITTGTSGWYMANWLGMLSPESAARSWIVAALIIITFLAITGMGILLPNSIRTYLELQKAKPDIQKIFHLNQRNNILAAVQGTFQIIIIIVMSHLVMG
jgi:hypothetical protein